jgi:DNA (cytosine-5)-methyltransferase 1
MKTPTVISTFAGCGGSSLGYRMAGFKELLAVEFNASAVATFEANFPEVPVFPGDIKDLSADACMSLAGIQPGELDVFDGSPPCQGFSIAGKREIGDPRNSLFREYVRLISVLRPKVFVFENVKGLVSGKMRAVYFDILKSLRDCGYDIRTEIKNAMYYGVPQSRERVIIVGVRNDLHVAPSLPKPVSLPISSGDALSGVTNDPEEVRHLLDDAEKRPHLRLWDRMEPGQHGDDVTGKNHFSLQKLDPSRPCPTITKMEECESLSGIMHWAERRKLTVAEAKRLSSFPNDFVFVGTRSDAMARIGNCVPPLLMKAIAEHIRKEILKR